ncbi:MAG: MFS transporter [Candidatus Dormibacteraeota bacterium]|nr:MFS transporter [Candidatus Dormibacteraeota bacterium]
MHERAGYRQADARQGLGPQLMAARLRRLAVDVRPLLESPPFRRLFAGQLVSLIGRQITVVAVPFQVYSLTRSPFAVGLLGLVQALPLIAFSLLAGAITDRLDRRRILMVTQLCLAVCSGALLVGALSGHISLAAIYLIVGVAAAFAAVDSPTRTAVMPRLVSGERLTAALALNILVFQTSLVAGPALGGLVIAKLGLGSAYLIDVATFAAGFTAVFRLPPQPPAGEHHEAPIAAIRRGLTFARKEQAILGGFAMDLTAMIFGLPRALFPVLAAMTFHVGPAGLGLLYAAPGFGAVLAILVTGWVSHAKRLGRVIVVTIAIWGVSIIAFGFARSLVIGLVLLAIAGGADSFSAVCRNTIMQTLTPDDLRGRVTALYFMVVVSGPYLGDLEAGAVASLTTPLISAVSGGVLSLLGLAAAAVRFPAVWRYRSGRQVVTLAGEEA